MAEVVDILLFGSAVKGKEFPRDVDLCVIFRKKATLEKVNEIEDKLRKFNVHVSALSVDLFFKKPHSLIKTLLLEGTSILSGRSLSRNFGFYPFALYSYDLSKIRPADRVRFIYLLRGRKEAGIVKKFGGEWIADGCFIMPIQKDSEMLAILKKWEVPYARREVLVH